MHEAHEALVMHAQVLWLIPVLPLFGFLVAICANRSLL